MLSEPRSSLLLSTPCCQPRIESDPLNLSIMLTVGRAILFPGVLRRLYVARDDDPAGQGASAILTDRARAAGIETIVLSPALEDFNEDLRVRGEDGLRATLRTQLAPQDLARFMALAA